MASRLDSKAIAYAAAMIAAVFVWLAAAVFVADAMADEAEPAGPVVTANGSALTASRTVVVADGSVRVSEDAETALHEGSAFGITAFTRLNKGTDRAVDGEYLGYRYSMVDRDAFAAIVCPGALLVHVPAQTAGRLGIDVADEDFQRSFLAQLFALDSANSRGGSLVSDLELPAYFTCADEVRVDGYEYRFGVAASDGYWYATVTLPGSQSGAKGALFAETGTLEAAADTQIAAAPTGIAWLQRFFDELDWRPLWVSLRTTGAAIVIVFVLGMLAAWWTMRVSDKVKGVLDTIFTIPMVLPPTVCGFLLMLLFGKSTDVGRWLIEHGIDLVFTWPAAVISCVVVGFPLMYRTVRGAFESVDADMLNAARTLGLTEWKLFRKVMMPMVWPSIAAGTVLAFARAMGEFGCTLFFAGNYEGVTQTIPIAIYYEWMGGHGAVALFWVVAVILISFAVILFINLYTAHTQRYRRKLALEGA